MLKQNEKQSKKIFYKTTILTYVRVVVFVCVLLSLNNTKLFTWQVDAAEENNVSPEEQQKIDEEKEAEREKAEKEAKDKQKKLEKLNEKKHKKEKVKAKYESEAGAIRQSINSIIGNIRGLENKIKATQKELDRINEEIKKQEEAIAQNKNILTDILQKLNKQKLELQLSILDGNRGVEDYIYQKDILEDLQTRILAETYVLKEKKRELDKKKKEADEAKEVLDDQKKTLEKEKVKKSWLYNGAQKKISEQEAEIREIEREMAALQSTISRLLGKAYNTNDIKQAAKFASKATGVRKAFILGMLTVETNLGRYTGGCTYKTSNMNSYRKKLFKQIAKETGHNYKKMKVSCPPKNYKGTGGAMGVAQFMSDTWMGYKAQIAAKTGHNPPDPWNLTDGVMAMALKLANDGATKKSGECRAAMRYLGGSHQWYCDKVLRYAKQYEK